MDITSNASTPMSSMNMDMGGDNSNACKISMLWNWYTINSCFISRGWHVRNAAAFAATCIVIFALVILLEFTRRAVKEYDCYVVDRWKRKAEDDEEANLAVLPEVSMEKMDSPLLDPNKAGRKFPFEANAARRSDWKERYRPTVLEQTIRSLLHTAQFTIAYFVMLLVMSYNGFVIICILLGAFFGFFIFGWEYLGVREFRKEESEPTLCCN